MKIHEILKNKRTLSFEIFPPKKDDASIDKIYKTVDNLVDLNPDFISVTYGAGGTNRSSNVKIAGYIKKCGVEPLAHLTGGPSDGSDIDNIAAQLKENNIENILALRGDKPLDFSDEYCKYFKHATDLISYLGKFNDDFCIAGACYPEGHPECETLYDDLQYLLKKEQCGAKFFISQLFYDNSYYYRLNNEARAAGLKSPIIPGIMPLTNPKSINRIMSMCGSAIPLEFRNMIEKYKNNAKVLEEIGINYTVYQIIDLIAKGAPGVHLYIMNNADNARKIYERAENVFKELF